MRSRWENTDKGSWLSFSKVKVVRVESEEGNRSLYFWVATVKGFLAGGYDVVVDKLPHQSKQHIVAVRVVLVVPDGQ